MHVHTGKIDNVRGADKRLTARWSGRREEMKRWRQMKEVGKERRGRR